MRRGLVSGGDEEFSRTGESIGMGEVYLMSVRMVVVIKHSMVWFGEGPVAIPQGK